MDTFAAPAFATDPASRYLLGRMPGARGTRLFSAGMIKMILGHLIYQVAIALILHFLGHSILGLDHSTQNDKVVVTLVFAWIFNSVNCRRLDNKLNISEGILNNQYFVVVTLIGTSPLSSSFCSTLKLRTVCRNWRTDSHSLRRKCCLPSQAYSRSRVGYFASTRFRFYPPWCPHSMRPHSTS
jgi:magnesium-transporting ATPase (P-type)